MSYSFDNNTYNFNPNFFPDTRDYGHDYSGSSSSASPDIFPPTPEDSFGELPPAEDIDNNIDPTLFHLDGESYFKGSSWQDFCKTVPRDIIGNASKLLLDTPTSLCHPPPAIARGRGYDGSRELFAYGSDEDADAEGDDDDADFHLEAEVKVVVGKRKRAVEADNDDSDDDDEYRPSSDKPATTKRRRTASPRKPKKGTPKSRGAYFKPTKVKTESSSPSPYQSVGENPDSETSRASSDARNQQSTGAMKARLEKAFLKGEGLNEMNFLCPQCQYKPRNKRLPDFKRHLATHVAHLSKTCCAGVLVEDADSFDIHATAEPVLHDGEYRIGGCMRVFSRMDALRRHLDNGNLGCVRYPSERGRS